MHKKTELSIIIPVLNEQKNLQAILASIALQQDIELEVIISDGGSEDATLKAVEESALKVTVIQGQAGRALQLNAGAKAATGRFLLFLHADSGLNDKLAFRRSIDSLCMAAAENRGKLYAGHFTLRFAVTRTTCLAYSYLERKARLNRKGCSHGDQGILIPADLFGEYGAFDERCQLLAETRLADKLHENDQWLLLPTEITTSARRFEREGLKERQTLNAAIMALGAVGFDEFLAMPEFYQPEIKSSKLQLQPIFRMIKEKISSLDEKNQELFWNRIGAYICENAWQIPFRIDLTLTCRKAISEHEGIYRLLGIYDCYLKRLEGNRLAIKLAAYAGSLWLQYMARG